MIYDFKTSEDNGLNIFGISIVSFFFVFIVLFVRKRAENRLPFSSDVS